MGADVQPLLDSMPGIAALALSPLQDIVAWNRLGHAVIASHLEPGEPDPTKLRERIYDDLDHIRKLRNRLAHHEPILTRNLPDDLARMLELVAIRSTETRTWLDQLEEATTSIAARP